MSAPVLTIPQGGPIAARPRREGLYDCEAFVSSGSVTTLPFFQNTRSFAETSAGTKQSGLDTNLVGNGGANPQGPHPPRLRPPDYTNLVGNGGSIPKGHYLRVFGAQIYMTRRGTATLTASAVDDKRKILDASYFRLLLGSTPYLDTPTHHVPAGSGISGPLATVENN